MIWKSINNVASDYIYNVFCKTDIGRQMAHDMLFLNNPITMTTRKPYMVFIAWNYGSSILVVAALPAFW